MPKFRDSATGVVVNVDDAKAERFRGSGWEPADQAGTSDKPGAEKKATGKAKAKTETK